MGSIPDETVEVGDTASVDVSGYFSDPDGDSLSYQAESSDTELATVSMSRSVVTVEGVGKGVATVKVTASDPDGLAAQQRFDVTVPNRAPEILDSIPGVEPDVGGTAVLNASWYFIDPDGDSLSYRAATSNAMVATASVSGSVVTVSAVTKGGAKVTVTASDPGGLSVHQDFAVMVPNRAPEAVDSLPDVERGKGDTASVDVSGHFRDPDGDALTYGAVSSNPAVATASVSGSVVTVSAVAKGGARVTVTASDPEGLSVKRSLRVTVPNRAPMALDSIPGVQPAAGGTATVDLSPHFADPDGDALSYEAASLYPAVATASVSGSVVTVSALVRGRSRVTVQATDPGGFSARQDFLVTVAPSLDRATLVALYEAMGGANWTTNARWLTDAPLERWHGVRTEGGRVVELALGGNNLEGPIPPALSELSHLRLLELWGNELTGTIPRALGDLSELRVVELWNNALSGLMPPELGNLSNLEVMSLHRNNLTGPIPRAFRRLSNLRVLQLSDNELTGAIRAEIGQLPNLQRLHLHRNELMGPIPPELGSLPRIEEILLLENRLSGPVPPELGTLPSLTQLDLTNNREMSGVLPSAMTALRHLDALLVGGTGICAPADDGFLAWLEGVHRRRVSICARPESMAYLVQAVQSRRFPVPLVAERRALLRVFVTATSPGGTAIPPVRTTFYVDGVETHVVDIPGQSKPIPTEVDEGDLSKSANAEIPGWAIRPGLEMVVEIDPEGTLDPGVVVTKRIPEEGRMEVAVRELSPLDVTFIPFLWNEDPDSSILDTIRSIALDPEEHELLRDTRMLLPVGGLGARAHDPVLTSTNNAFDLLSETGAIRVMEGGAGHYMGMMAGSVTGASGVAWVPGRSSFSVPNASTIAHELGHNLSLRHAPCGHADAPDPSYPEWDGSIGAWGYDFRQGGRLVPPDTPDLMSYCGPKWISDYHFANVLRFRLSDDYQERPATAPAEGTILLWGGVGAGGDPFLEPAFLVGAPPALPDSAGAYEITGRSGGGDELFSLSFGMPKVADGGGRSGFAFALPVRPEWAGVLASVTLSGPGGSFTLDRGSDRPAAILLDRRTGQVRGILRGLPPSVLAPGAGEALVPEPGLRVLVSGGIPRPEDWRR